MTSGPSDFSERHRSPEIRADDLESLNQLLASLLQAGLPLESGLKAVAGQWPGRAGSALRQLSNRLGQGESLESAIAELGTSLPVEYVALVRAGQRTGRLGQILSDLARMARLREETRRMAVVAMIYPLIIACFAIFLGIFLLRNCIPMIQEDMLDARSTPPELLTWMANYGRQLQKILSAERILGLTVFAVGFVLVISWRFGYLAEKFAERLPLLGTAWSNWRTAMWAELMAMLLENETPESEALELSGLALGNRKMANRLTALATHLRTGHRPVYDDWAETGLPSMAIWSLNWSGPIENRISTLRTIAQNYANNARHRLNLAFGLIPIIMLVAIGGLFTLIYGLLLFLPITSLYRSLT